MMMLSQNGPALVAALFALSCGGATAALPGTVALTATSPLGAQLVTASLPIRLEFLSDGVDAWPDLPLSKLRNPPPFLRLLPTTLSNWNLAFGTEVTFTCPNEPTLIDVCDAWVFHYQCAQSCVGTYQGGLPGLLSVTPGWERTRCAPSFVTGVAGTSFVHSMGSFRQQLAPGTSVSFTLPGDSEFLAFGIDADGVDCTKRLTVGECPVSEGRCRWENDECINQTCHQGNKGPPPPCRECPWQGLVARPPSDGPFGGGPF